MRNETSVGLPETSATNDRGTRRCLVAAARRLLWGLVRWRAAGSPGMRGALRRRIASFLRRSDGRSLVAILRSLAFAAAVAAGLVAGESLRAQGIELADVARGEGGFVVRGEGEPAAGVGQSVSGAGDVNGDGLADVIVGAPLAGREGVPYAGVSYVVFGTSDGAGVDLQDILEGRGGFAIRGDAAGDYAGESVAGAGDVDGDGRADLVIGASSASPEGRHAAGESYVVFGKPDGAIVELSSIREGRGGFAIRGSTAGDSSGWSVSGAGDVDGDGLSDLIVGAPDASPGYVGGAGECYVVFGKSDGAAVELWDVQTGRGGFAIRGVREGDYSGFAVSGAGDVDGDGLADLLIGAPYASAPNRYAAGQTYVVFGKTDGAAIRLWDVEAGRGGFAIRGAAEGGLAGWSVAGPGDVDGDGLADVLLGAYYASPPGRDYAGESYVVFGKQDGVPVELEDVVSGMGGFAILGVAAYDYSGMSVSGAGDVDGDGLADLLIGAPAADTDVDVGVDAGETYVVLGKAGGAAVDLLDVRRGLGGFAIRGGAEYDYSGQAVSGAGDVDGDGFPDLLIGARRREGRYEDAAGAAYVVFGRGDASPKPRFRRGAVRGDETVNLSDAVSLLHHLFLGGAEPLCLDAADVDDSGRLDLADAVSLLGHLFRGGEPPPSPGPSTCGEDPTADDLGCEASSAGCGR